jgi:hypothetical protein
VAFTTFEATPGGLTIVPSQLASFTCVSPVKSGTRVNCTATLAVPSIGFTNVKIEPAPIGLENFGLVHFGNIAIPDGRRTATVGLLSEKCCIEPKTVRLLATLRGVSKTFDVTLTAP